MMMISVVVFMRGRLLQRLGPVHHYLTGPTAHPSRTSRLFAPSRLGSRLWAESFSLRQRGARHRPERQKGEPPQRLAPC
jgi:hypothetical protein